MAVIPETAPRRKPFRAPGTGVRPGVRRMAGRFLLLCRAMKTPGESAADGGRAADVLVVGGGPVGLAAACLLARAGLAAVVVDAQAPGIAAAPDFDGRASAVAAGSAAILERAGIWQALEAEAEPIREIRVSDGDSRLFLHFDHADLGLGPLGYMAENRHLLQALRARAATLPDLAVLAPRRVVSVARGTAVRAALDDGSAVRARLLVAADGAHSPMRGQAGIPARRRNYDQAAIVCTVAHERPHRGVAQERFLPAGPFAILPLARNRSSLVWTEKPELARAAMAFDDKRFLAEIERRFTDCLGALTLAGPRRLYPVALVRADRMTDRRLALAGDAARAIHPIAGQGLNLGLRDAAALADCVLGAARLGLDIGGREPLRRYERARSMDSLTMSAATDGLNRLFVAALAPVAAARRIGLAAVNRAPALKRVFMRRAMGL